MEQWDKIVVDKAISSMEYMAFADGPHAWHLRPVCELRRLNVDIDGEGAELIFTFGDNVPPLSLPFDSEEAAMAQMNAITEGLLYGKKKGDRKKNGGKPGKV